MIPLEKVKQIVDTYKALEKELASGDIDKKDFAKKSKGYSNIREIIKQARSYLGFEKEKEELEKIILCDVQKQIKPNIEKVFTDLINNSGFKGVSFKNIDFEKLYNSRIN
jgi:peptide chain release factor 1